jgi:hypothetical protein
VNIDAHANQSRLQFIASELLLAGEEMIEKLNDCDLFRAESLPRLGHLHADRPAADHQQTPRHIFGGGHVPGIPSPGPRKTIDRREGCG